ncbi:MAG: tyrosine-type recombinase/integrase [Maricaulaceae bacterium]
MEEGDSRRKHSKDIPAAILNASEGPFLKLYHEFINVSIKSRDTARTYKNATTLFLLWCQENGIDDIIDIEPITVRKYVDHLYEDRGRKSAAKVAYYGSKTMFQYFVDNGALKTNPAAGVKYPFVNDTRGKTQTISKEEVRAILDHLTAITEREDPPAKPTDYRDRALIALMAFGFVRIGGSLSVRRGDYYKEDGHWWMDFEEKGAQCHSLPILGELKEYIDSYIQAGSITDKDKWLFQSANRNGALSGKQYDRGNSRIMIAKRANQAGIEVDKISNHTFRATGITNFLQEGGTMSEAQDIANHKHQETTKRYDRRDRTKLISVVKKIKY